VDGAIKKVKKRKLAMCFLISGADITIYSPIHMDIPFFSGSYSSFGNTIFTITVFQGAPRDITSNNSKKEIIKYTVLPVYVSVFYEDYEVHK
jgi:hypothetical protein